MKFSSFDLAGPDPRPMSIAEVKALKVLVKYLPPNPAIIQIGAERGCSTLAMLETRPDAFIFSIDIGEQPKEHQNLERAGLELKRVVRGLGRSQNIGRFWPLGWAADLVYIDGDHRYAGVADDIRVWLPNVASGGILAFHDYIHPDIRGPQIRGRVFEAIRDAELLDKYPVQMTADRIIAFRITHHAAHFRAKTGI